MLPIIWCDFSGMTSWSSPYCSGMISICWSSQTFGRKLLTKGNPDQVWKQSLNQSWRLLSAAQQAISINSAPQQFRRIKFSHFWSIFNNFRMKISHFQFIAFREAKNDQIGWFCLVFLNRGWLPALGPILEIIPKIHQNALRWIFWIENDHPHPHVWKSSKNSSNFVVLGLP